jgi:hypothetical protein
MVEGHRLNTGTSEPIVADKEFNQQERPYSKPTLMLYGKAAELTTLVANKLAKGNNTNANIKTSVTD